MNGLKNKVSTIWCAQKTHLKDSHGLKVKGWTNANRNQKRAGMAILSSDKIDFQSKSVTRDREGPYILIKVSINQ